MKKLANLFPHADKVLHFIVGALIALIVLWVTNVPWYGFSAAFLVGLYKEFSDNLKQDSVERTYVINSYADWFATIAGGLLVEWLI